MNSTAIFDRRPAAGQFLAPHRDRFVWTLCGLAWLGGAFGLSAAQVVESDVCIYGGTSGGVIAAVQAARMGKTVVVVEPGRHLGGMTSGGLGATDTGNIGTIGGLSREFYRRVGQRYGRPESLTFEPHVAEETFATMLREVNAPVYYQHRLASVTKAGQRITAIVTENGDEFRARMFLDTTYEGDLLAAAGVSFTVGREATNTYNESLNGIRPSTPSHQFALAVDPYMEPGNPASGLLPNIQTDGGGTPGQGDHRVQAYNFRLCLTQVATNRRDIMPPMNFDSARYELLGRYIEARVAAGHTLTLGSFMNISTMPNGKTDINNNGAFSTDFIGMNYTYPTNTWAARDVMWKEHEDYIRGLLIFLASDDRVPENVRTNMQAWGLCLDEFPDTDGWPHQLYVREARRMVSDYFIIQADCEGKRVAADSVGLASYNMDSHNCQRFVVSGSVTNEGDVQRAPAGPFPISYRAIVPRVGECENLFATFCLSGSHIAFSSARMEPVFMITSQSAAAAAVFAINDNVAVQNVPYGKLRLQMLADGQVLTWGATAPVPTNSIVLDTEVATNAITVSGGWSTSSASPGFYGASYLHDGNVNKGTKSVRFTPNLPNAGQYTVQLRWTTNANRATNVPLTITHADGVTNLTVNQRLNNGVWVSLGTYSFTGGTNGSLLLETTGTDGFVIADATLWQPLAETPLPTVEVIASDAVAAEDGPDAAVFTIARTGETTGSVTIAYTLSGPATPGLDFPAASGSLVIPPGQAFAKLTLLPLGDNLAEGDETVTLTLATNSAYQLGVYTNASVVIRDGGYGLWRSTNFTIGELADDGVSGPAADPDLDGANNLLEYFHGTNPKSAGVSPPLQIRPAAEGWVIDWQRAPAGAAMFLRLESSTDLAHWQLAPFAGQIPTVTDAPPIQQLRFAPGNLAQESAFFRVAVSPTPLALLTNDAHFFFSFDTTTDGTNAFQIAVTTNQGFAGTPAITRTGTVLADAGGATNFTDFTGTTWLGSGGSTTPGHSACFNNGSQNNSISLVFSTLGLRQVRLRMDIRSAAQAGGVAAAAFSSFTYDVGGGPQPVPGVNLNVVVDNAAYHEWLADLATLAEINNRPSVTLTWTVKNLQGTPAESFRMDNLQVTASPIGE